MRFPPSLLDEIRARLPVSQVVGRRVNLRRQGREYIGLSPFKVEKSPSFTVNDLKGFYHCFSSGEHGDIFKFVMATEGLTFPEAVERLASEAGVPMPAVSEQVVQAEGVRSRLHEANEAACRLFETALAGAGASAREARAYLDRRGLSGEARKRFRLGFAPDNRSVLKDSLMRAGFTQAELIEAGLLVAGPEIASPYDRFRGRLMIPITDLKARVIAFGGRILDPDGKPKYLNSPETPLFHKGSVLFNAARARQAAHDGAGVLVVEGYMDVIALVEAGFTHAVAPLGTALTENQIGLLWRLAPEPVLCFDGDAAGRKAAWRAVDTVLPLLQPGKSLAFAFMPDGLDPDDLIRQQGAPSMARVLARPDSLIDVLWARERDREPLDTPERRAALEKRVATLAAAIREPAVREQYGRELRQLVRDHNWQAIKSHGTRDGAARDGRRPTAPADWRQRTRNGGQGPADRRSLRPQPAAAPAGDSLRRSLLVVDREDAAGQREALLLKTLVSHPWLAEHYAEEMAILALRSPQLARLRDAILETASQSPLDSVGLASHLRKSGLGDALQMVDRALTHKSDTFAEPDASHQDADFGFRHTLARHQRSAIAEQIRSVERIYFDEESEQAFAQLKDLQARLAELSRTESSEDPPAAGRSAGSSPGR